MRDSFEYLDLETESLGGTNFLVSAVMLLKKQKRELLEENQKLKSRLNLIEGQNAEFLNLSADRLLENRG
jgi:hypothetical protein